MSVRGKDEINSSFYFRQEVHHVQVITHRQVRILHSGALKPGVLVPGFGWIVGEGVLVAVQICPGESVQRLYTFFPDDLLDLPG